MGRGREDKSDGVSLWRGREGNRQAPSLGWNVLEPQRRDCANLVGRRRVLGGGKSKPGL